MKRLNRKSTSYKITKEEVKHHIQKLKVNEQLTIKELCKIVKKNIKILIKKEYIYIINYIFINKNIYKN